MLFLLFTGELLRMRKKLPCPFCVVSQSKLTRHIERIHYQEAKVQKIIKACEELRGTSLLNYRRKEFKKLALQGCGQHNFEVRRKGRGELILAKQTSNPPEKCLECPECYGLYKDLKRHKCLKKRV